MVIRISPFDFWFWIPSSLISPSKGFARGDLMGDATGFKELEKIRSKVNGQVVLNF